MTTADAESVATKRVEIRTVAILRGYAPDDAVQIAQRCWATGIDLVEVTVQSPESWEALAAIRGVADGRMVGAGTVVSVELAQRAVQAGAAPLITPGFDSEVVNWAQEAGVPILPGVTTATEVTRAVAHGVRTCKLCPAGVLGADYLRALRGPFPDVAFVATGAVGAANAHDLVAAGAAALAFGGQVERVLDSPATLAAAASITSPWSLTAE